MRRTVIIGCGLIGRALIDHYRPRVPDPRSLVVVARSIPDELLHDPRLTTVFGEVGSGGLTGIVEDGDLVIAAHGLPAPRIPVEGVRRILEPVARATSEIVEAVAAREGIRLIQFSSGGAVYGPHADPVDEQSPLQPTTPYAATKAAEEYYYQLLEGNRGARVVTLRCSTVYGLRRDVTAAQGLVHLALRSLHLGEAVPVFGRGASRRGYLLNSDLARVVQVIGEAEDVAGVLNVCSGQVLSIVEVVRTAAHVLGVEPRIDFVDGPEHDIVLDNSKLTRLLDGFDFTPFSEGVLRMVASLGT